MAAPGSTRSSAITITCATNVTVVPANGDARLVYLLIDIGSDAPRLQAPVNLAIALDVSESMRLPVLTKQHFDELSRLGQVNRTVSDGVPVWTFKQIPEHIRRDAPSNIEAVQSAIADAGAHFEPGDHVSLVAFADRTEVLLRGIAGDRPEQLLDAVRLLSTLNLGDETDIAAGLEAGMGEVDRQRAPGMVNRVLVLTDGFTRDPDRVLTLARGAKERGIAVSTLGIGSEFNESLLVEAADASLGNAYFARTPQDIPPAFKQELDAVQSVAVRDVRVEVKLSAGVEVRRAYRVRPAISTLAGLPAQSRTLTMQAGDLDPTNPPSLLVELLVPGRPDGTFRVAAVEAAGQGEGEQPVSASASDITLSYSSAAPTGQDALNPTVMNTVERVTAYVLQTRALEDIASGNLAAATHKLQAAATRLLTVGEAKLAETVRLEAERLEERGAVSAEGAKEIRYATRKLTQRLPQ